jgi:ferrochelatase
MTLILVNFGGPRNLEEIAPFLRSLLTDKEVVRTRLPKIIHDFLFSRVAKKRAIKIRHDYELIGGKSPIYEDTESIAQALRESSSYEVIPFHRYLPSTHPLFFEQICRSQKQEMIVFPLFPQFSYATTGSIARFFSEHLCAHLIHKMRWIKSYSAHPAYIRCFQAHIRAFLIQENLKEEETLLLFSAHGVPKKFICTGDIYQTECYKSFNALASGFPHAVSKLCYQSKFGKGEWLRPATDEICEQILNIHEGRKQVVVIPLSFTSDHIETLFEVEQQYLPIIRKKGLKAYRCPALNLRKEWIAAIDDIVRTSDVVGTQMLIRHPYN